MNNEDISVSDEEEAKWQQTCNEIDEWYFRIRRENEVNQNEDKVTDIPEIEDNNDDDNEETKWQQTCNEIDEWYFRIRREIEDNDIPEIEDNNDDDNDNEWQKTVKDNRDVNTDEDNTTDIPEIEDNQDDDVDVDNTTNGDREEFVVGMNSFQHKLMKDIKTLRELRETLSSETNKIWADPHTSKLCDNDLDKEEEKINVWKKHKKQKNKLGLKDVPYSPKRCVYCGWFSKSRSRSNYSHSLNRHIQVKHQNKK